MTAGVREVAGLRCEVARVTAELDPALLDTAGAVRVLEHVVAMRNMLAAVQAELAAKIAATEQWRRAGFRSAEEWLASKAGMSRPQAAGSIDTGKRMRAQEKVAKAAKAGVLSPEQARLVSAAAAADPSAEQRLVEQAARGSVGELREACDRVRAAADPSPEATHARIRAARYLRHWLDGEGTANLAGRGVADEATEIRAALDEIADELLTRDRLAGKPLASREAYGWDALLELARRWNTRFPAPDGEDADGAGDADDVSETDDAGDTAEDAGAEPAPGETAGTPTPASSAPAPVATAPPARTRRGRARPWLALLRIDVSALQRGIVEGEELCEIAGVGTIPVSVARRLLGDAVLKLVITRGVDVANLTHLGRGPTVAQRCGLLWRDPRCVVEGCDRLWDEADHRVDYADTRHTTLSELEGHCGHHHDLKTYDGWALVPGTGRRPMVPPDDPRHPKNTGPPSPLAPPGTEEPGTLFP